MLAESSRSDADRLSDAGQRLAYAADVAAAVRRTRRRPSPTLVAAVIVTATVVVAGSAVVRERTDRARDRQETALQAKAEELRQLATGSGRGTIHDQELQSLLLLIASALARDAGDPDTADDIF